LSRTFFGFSAKRFSRFEIQQTGPQTNLKKRKEGPWDARQSIFIAKMRIAMGRF
jgi:hypothetical protein